MNILSQKELDLLYDASIKLEDSSPKTSLEVLKLIDNYSKNPQIKRKIKSLQSNISKNERHILVQNKQISLLRQKFNQLHAGLVSLGSFEDSEIDSAISRLNPLEIVNKSSKNTLMVFGGMLSKPSMPPKEFFRSIHNLDVNLIFIKDFEQCWYQKGLLGLSSNPEETAMYLKNIIPASTRNLITMGMSSGGYGAILFGTMLNAKKIIAFSPQTKITDKVFKRFKSFDTRKGDIDLNNDFLNLPEYLQSIEVIPKIDVYYGKLNESDNEAAQNIRNYATLHGYETNNHTIAKYLKEKSLLQEILDKIV